MSRRRSKALAIEQQTREVLEKPSDDVLCWSKGAKRMTTVVQLEALNTYKSKGGVDIHG